MGVAIALGLLGMGSLIKNGIDGFKNKERVVSVKGLCEQEVPADYVIWPLVYKEVGNDLTRITANVNDKNEEIIRFLTSEGIDRSEISISAPASSTSVPTVTVPTTFPIATT